MAAEVHRRIAEVLSKARTTAAQLAAMCALGNELLAVDADGALECFDRALRIDQGHASAWVGRANVLTRKNRAGEALNCVERALERDPESLAALLLKAQVLSKVGSRREALECVEKVLASAPNNEDVLVSHAYLLSEMGREGDALLSLDKAIAVKARSSTYATRGDILGKMGRHSDAALAYRRAVEIDPADPEGWYRLGMSRKKAQDFDGTRQAFRKFMEVAPKGDPRLSAAAMLLDPGVSRRVSVAPAAPEGARKVSADADTLPPPPLDPESGLTVVPPDGGPPPIQLAAQLHEEGRDVEALRIIERALRESDEDNAMWLLRAKVLLSLGKPDPASSSAVLAARRDPTNGEAWKLSARAYLETRKVDRALDAAERAYGLLPSDPDVHILRGDCLVQLNRHLEAVYAYEKATHFGPTRTQTWLALGKVLRHLERVPAARVALEKAKSVAEANVELKLIAEAQALLDRL